MARICRRVRQTNDYRQGRESPFQPDQSGQQQIHGLPAHGIQRESSPSPCRNLPL